MDALVLREPAASAPLPVLEFEAGQKRSPGARLLARDIIDGARLWRLAFTLGWLDIKLRYRGSLLGPFWLTLSTGATVVALGVLYATLFKVSVKNYVPFLALSQVLWIYISVVIAEAGTVFTQAEGVIRSVRMPFFVQAQRLVVRNLVVLAHNFLVVVVMYAVYGIWPGWEGLWCLPGLVLWVVDSLAIAMLLGALCARFRDIPPIVTSLMQLFFFVTPIIWLPSQLPHGYNWILVGNPFFDILEVVRSALLGYWPGDHVWIAALVFSAAICGVTWLFLTRARSRIAFWL